MFGGVERGTGCCFLVVVKDRSEAKLLELIKKWIFPGSIILSDCWKSYSNIRWDFVILMAPKQKTNLSIIIYSNHNDYTHMTVNQDQHYKDSITGTHTNTVEGIIVTF